MSRKCSNAMCLLPNELVWPFWLHDAAFLRQNDIFKKILEYMEKYTVQVNRTLVLASCTCRLDVYDMQVRSRRFWIGAKTAYSSKSHRFPGQQKNIWPCSTLVYEILPVFCLYLKSLRKLNHYSLFSLLATVHLWQCMQSVWLAVCEETLSAKMEEVIRNSIIKQLPERMGWS